MRQCPRPEASGTRLNETLHMKRGTRRAFHFECRCWHNGGLVSEEAHHARLLNSAKRHDPRLAFTTLLLELLPGASCCCVQQIDDGVPTVLLLLYGYPAFPPAFQREPGSLPADLAVAILKPD